MAIVERCEPAAVKSLQKTVKEEDTVIVVGDGQQFGMRKCKDENLSHFGCFS